MSVIVEFTTIPELFRMITAKFANDTKPIMRFKSEGRYQSIRYSEFQDRVESFACGLASLGIRRGDRVAIISENRPEWAISDLAITLLGAVDVPVYPTMTAKENEFIFNDAGVKLAIVSNQFQLNKVLKIFDNVRSLETVVIMTEKGSASSPHTIGFSVVLQKGEKFRQANPSYVDDAIATVRPEDLLTLIYTSGTTGNPKGVMLTHANLVSNVQSAATVIDFGVGDEVLSFLPLSHSFERMAGYYTAMACGVIISYAESVESVRDNMLEVRPTVVTTVPRLFERIHSRIMKKVQESPTLRQKIFFWAIKVGRAYALAKKRNRIPVALAVRRALADRLVFSTIRERTGGRLRFFISGGAALAREFGEFFEAIGIKIIEGYGLTESSPVITVNRLENYKWGSVGSPIPGVEVRIAEDGEILARGPNIMKGYWNNTDATKEVLDKEGWLHTGDIGVIDSEGFLYITDRKKHLIVSSGGKNIAPQPIENLFLSSRYIEQFVLIGDRRMFLTALVVPDHEALKEYADSHQIPYSSDAELVRLKEITSLVEKEIGLLQKDLANYERVRKFTLLEKPFSIEEGELTPTMKVKRKVVETRYAHLIEEMYAGIR